MSQFYYSQYAHQAHTTAPRFGFAANPELAAAYAVLWLRPGAPHSVAKAAYRALAAQYHPDAGGDARAMQRLNEAYETINRHLAPTHAT